MAESRYRYRLRLRGGVWQARPGTGHVGGSGASPEACFFSRTFIASAGIQYPGGSPAGFGCAG